MFNFFRSREKSARYLIGAILVVISLSMLLYLIPGGAGGGSTSSPNVVATVGGDKITVGDVQGALERVAGSQPNFPRAFMAMYVPTIVNQYVEMYAKAYKAQKLGLSVTDEELASTIQRMMAPQMGGKFDKNLYGAALEQRGFTIPQFESFLRVNMLSSRYDAIAGQSLVVTDSEARKEFERENEKVALQFIQFSQKDFASKVKPDSAALNAWFAKHRAQFQDPEKRSFELIVGSDVDFAKTVKPSDQDLRKSYQDNIDSYRTPERVMVRHVLIKTTDVPKDQVPKLHQKAEDILKQLKDGADFATLAKKNSDDPGSAQKGGELGWVVKGQTVPAFEKAAFSLKPNELSDVITTEYGFHIIQVQQHQDARVESFDEAKPQLLAEAQKELGAQNMEKAMTTARDETARNPSQAQAIAQKYGLRFFKVDQATTTTSLPELNTQQDVANAIFGARKGEVTQVIALNSPPKSAYGIVTGITPPHQAQFDEVQAQVVSQYTAEQAQKLMTDAANSAAQRAKKGESLELIAKSEGGQLKSAQPFTMMGAAEGIGAASTVADAFAPPAKVGDAFGPLTQGDSVFIYKITQKTPADMSTFAQNRENMIQTLKQKKGEVQGALFGDSIVADLKKHGVIKINNQAIQQLAASFKS
jgi:peptidyl-prolyl cis-trans isomerase D